MIISIHQPEFFPWVSFFDKIEQSDIFVFLDSVQFEKNYFQNRSKIRDGKGEFQIITLPVKYGDHSLSIANKEIDCNNRLVDKMLKTVQLLYSQTPYFEIYFETFRDIIKSFKYLGDLNIELIQFICQSIGLKKKFIKSSILNLDKFKSTELLLEICKIHNAKSYLSGKMGGEYLDETLFRDEGIEIIYQDYKFHEYPQLQETKFIPCLGILDLLFNCGDDSFQYIKKGRVC